jgi:hypothetical protein
LQSERALLDPRIQPARRRKPRAQSGR